MNQDISEELRGGLALLLAPWSESSIVTARDQIRDLAYAPCLQAMGLLRQTEAGIADKDQDSEAFARLLAATFANRQAAILKIAGRAGAIHIGLGSAPENPSARLDLSALRTRLTSFLPGLHLGDSWHDPSDPLPVEGVVFGLPRRPPDYEGTYGIDWTRLLNTLSRDRFELSIEARPVDPSTTNDWLQQVWATQQDCHERAKRTQGEQTQKGQATQETRRPNIALSLWRLAFGGVAMTGETGQSTEIRSLSGEEIDANAMALERLAEETAERFLNGLKTGLWLVSIRFSCADLSTAERLGGLLTGELSIKDRDAAPLRVVLSERRFEQPPRPSPLTTEELAGLIGLPHRGVPGFAVAEVPALDTSLTTGNGARIGEVLHLASPNGGHLRFDRARAGKACPGKRHHR